MILAPANIQALDGYCKDMTIMLGIVESSLFFTTKSGDLLAANMTTGFGCLKLFCLSKIEVDVVFSIVDGVKTEFRN